MAKNDFNEFQKVIVGLAEALDKSLSAQRIVLYFNALYSFDIRAVKFAAAEIIKVAEYFPKAAQIREYAKLWKSPALSGGSGQKMLESKEQREARFEENRQRMAELREGLATLDEKYGTALSEKVA